MQDNDLQAHDRGEGQLRFFTTKEPAVKGAVVIGAGVDNIEELEQHDRNTECRQSLTDI